MKRILLILILWSVFVCTLARPSWCEELRVERVSRGNFLVLSNDQRVILIGLDVPETRINDNAKRLSKNTGYDLDYILAHGNQARKFAENLALNQIVHLELDEKKETSWGNTLAYVWIEIGDEGHLMLLNDAVHWELRKKEDGNYGQFIFMNATLLKAGYARPRMRLPNTKYEEDFDQYFKEAVKYKRGMWKFFIMMY